jgi:hypothetical protein
MNDSQLSLANRKQLADLLKSDYEGLRYKAKRRLSDRRRELRDSIIEETAEKKGCSGIVKKLQEAERLADQLTAELRKAGFDYCNGSMRLYDEDSNPLDKLIDARLDKELGTEREIDAAFDVAQIELMTVQTLADAEKILKSLSEVR